MALPDAIRRPLRMGISSPRIAPPVPARSLVKDYEAAAAELGIKLMAWQRIAAHYILGTANRRWLYREVAAVVARQNGKTTLLLPLIWMGLKRGERILHTAQNRAIPRETFLALARLLNGRSDVDEIRFANGQELIRMANGGRYTLVAPRPGVRGHATDRVLLDEVREQRSFDLLASIKPTLTASRNPQVIYLSNAGDEDSVVLNDLRRRADTDVHLAYLEWSAAPERGLDDELGWAEANPALGVTIQLDTLADFRGSLPPQVFETEHLCRWVISMQPRLIAAPVWERARMSLEAPVRPMLGFSMDASGKRAAAAIAWQMTDGSIGLQVVADVTGDPIDTDRFGIDLRELANRLGVFRSGFAKLTDAELARYVREPKAIDGSEFANACANFVRVTEAGRLRWDGADSIMHDLAWTARKSQDAGAWIAIKAKDDRPIPAVLAAIRAVWLASGPRPSAPVIF